MFYIVKEMQYESTPQIALDTDRDYETVLNFVREVLEASGNIDEFGLSEACELDEIYEAAGEKRREDEVLIPRSPGLKKGVETSSETITNTDTRPSLRRAGSVPRLQRLGKRWGRNH